MGVAGSRATTWLGEELLPKEHLKSSRKHPSPLLHPSPAEHGAGRPTYPWPLPHPGCDYKPGKHLALRQLETGMGRCTLPV